MVILKHEALVIRPCSIARPHSQTYLGQEKKIVLDSIFLFSLFFFWGHRGMDEYYQNMICKTQNTHTHTHTFPNSVLSISPLLLSEFLFPLTLTVSFFLLSYLLHLSLLISYPMKIEIDASYCIYWIVLVSKSKRLESFIIF